VVKPIRPAASLGISRTDLSKETRWGDVIRPPFKGGGDAPVAPVAGKSQTPGSPAGPGASGAPSSGCGGHPLRSPDRAAHQRRPAERILPGWGGAGWGREWLSCGEWAGTGSVQVREEDWKTWRNGAGPAPGRRVCSDTEAGVGAGMPTGEGEPARAIADGRT
jgi:hypothetical protein